MKVFFTAVTGMVAAVFGIITAAVVITLVAAAIPTAVLVIIGIAAQVFA